MDPMIAKALLGMNLQRMRDEEVFYQTHCCEWWYNLRCGLRAFSNKVTRGFERNQCARRPGGDTAGQVKH